MSDLMRLAELIRARNVIDDQIAAIIGYPAHAGHIAEYVAAAVFDIVLNQSKAAKGTDGFFTAGALSRKSVNIKFKAKQDGILDLVGSSDPADHPDYYLVMTGPNSPPTTSRGMTAPWIIAKVFLFDAHVLLLALAQRGRRPGGVQIGIATSAHGTLWQEAMAYPEAHNNRLILTQEQQQLLSLFGSVP